MNKTIKIIADRKDLESLKLYNTWSILDIEFNTDTQVYEVIMIPTSEDDL